MKYNQPFGISDPEAAYINGNPATGTMGSIPPASSVEYDQREIVAVIKYAFDKGLIDFNNVACASPSNSDLQQLLKAIFGMTNKNKLQGNVILYIDSDDGDDLTADGTLAKPYRTIQAAVNKAQSTIDVNRQHRVTFHAAGTFTDSTYLVGAFAGQSGYQSIVFDNSAATFNVPAGSCFYVALGAQCTIKGGLYSAPTSSGPNHGIAINCGGDGMVEIQGVTFGTCAVAHIWSEGLVQVTQAYTIAGSAPYHFRIMPTGGVFFSSPGAGYNVNIPSPLVFTTFAQVYGGTLTMAVGGFSGGGAGTASVGKKHYISGFGQINTNTGNPATFFPGNDTTNMIAANTGNGEFT